MNFQKLSQRVPASVVALTLIAQLIAPSVYAANTHSVHLNGTSQYLSIADGSQTGLDVGTDLTLEAWVKFDALPTASSEMILAAKYDADNSGRSYQLAYIDDSGTRKFRFASSDNCASGTTGDLTYSNFVTDTWYHVAVSKNGTTATFFVNGEDVGSVSASATLCDNNVPFTIGVRMDTSPYGFFEGNIDDVRVWNVARTETEIAENRSVELVGNESGLVGYWKLDNSLTDETSNNNDLTNNGSATFSSDVYFVGKRVVRKATDESIMNETALQSDNDLELILAKNTSYIVDGVIFVTSTSAVPNLRLGLFANVDATIRVGASNNANELMLVENTTSSPLSISAGAAIPVRFQGTIEMGSSNGIVNLKWAQAISDGAAISVLEGGYLRAEEIQ